VFKEAIEDGSKNKVVKMSEHDKLANYKMSIFCKQSGEERRSMHPSARPVIAL
jgi:hypothetical protein